MSGERTLDDVRKEIDAIDDALHDLIVRRTALVERVRSLKRDWRIKIQPSREAEIIYRRMERHRGPFPRRELVAIWRQLIIATLSFEGPFSVAVYMPTETSGYWDLARDQYGIFTPMTRHGSARSVIGAVRRQDATVGVLPLPRCDDVDPWWRHIVTDCSEAPRIIARLPFAGPSNGLGGAVEGLVICPVSLKPTGRDRSFLAIGAEKRIVLSRLTGALSGAGLTSTFATVWHEEQEPRAWLCLIEIDGFLAENDPRLERFRRALGEPLTRLLPLGGYAMPLSADVLGPAAVAPIAVPSTQSGDQDVASL